jgi:hypothetical protein
LVCPRVVDRASSLARVSSTSRPSSSSFATVAGVVVAALVGVGGDAYAGPIAERGAAHWVDRSGDLPNEPLTAVAVDPSNPRILWVGLDGFVFRSDDEGENFVAVLSFPRGLADDAGDETVASAVEGAVDGPTSNADRFGTDDVSDGLDDGAGEDLPDGSTTTAPVEDADPLDSVDISVPSRVEAGVRGFAFVSGSPGVVLVATPRGLWRTIDSGGAFAQVQIPGGVRANDVRDVAVDPERPSRLFVASAAGLWLSRDGGASFSRGPGRSATVPGVCLDVASIEGATQVIYGTELGLMRSKDGGASFVDLLLRGTSAFPVIHAVARQPASPGVGEIVYAGTRNGLFAAERGAPILERYNGMPTEAATAVVVDPLEPGGVAVAVRNGAGGVLFSDDAGLSLVDVDVLPAQQALALSRDRKDPTQLWVAAERGLFRLEKGTGITLAKDQARALRERFAKEPSLNRLTLTALKEHGIAPTDDVPMERAWWAAAVPRIEARYSLTAGATDDVRQTFLFRDPAAVALAPFLDPTLDDTALLGDGVLVFSPEQKFTNTLWIGLSWDLDRVLMNATAMSAARQIPVRAGAERDVINRVQALYVQRRRLVAELYVAPRRVNEAGKRERILKELRLLELEAHLASLVGFDAFDPANP